MTGLLLPVWDKLPADHVQVIRIAAGDGRSLLGREIPLAHLSELGAIMGLEIPLNMPPDGLAATVLRTGRPLPVQGPEVLALKRSLGNRSQRLEPVGFSAARLARYKAQGCFTEINRYKTRLFVPVDQASKVLGRLLPERPSLPVAMVLRPRPEIADRRRQSGRFRHNALQRDS